MSYRKASNIHRGTHLFAVVKPVYTKLNLRGHVSTKSSSASSVTLLYIA